MTFANIGQAARAVAQSAPNVVGTKLGKTDAALSPQHLPEIAEWLARHSPADMDKAAVSRASSHGVKLNVKIEGRYPSGPKGERLPSYSVAVGCAIMGNDVQRKAALADLEKFQTSACVNDIEEWIGELSALTAGKNVGGFDAELLISAYSSRLLEYPADVVRKSLLGKTWKWFPTWDELKKVCESLASPRLHMIAALMRPEPDLEPKQRAPTQDEKQRIAALVAEQFASVPQAWRDRAGEEVTQGKCFKEES